MFNSSGSELRMLDQLRHSNKEAQAMVDQMNDCIRKGCTKSDHGNHERHRSLALRAIATRNKQISKLERKLRNLR